MSQASTDRTKYTAPPADFEDQSSEQLKRRIDHTRGAMDETLNELGERLNPHSLLEDAMELFRSSATQDAAKRTGEAIGQFAQNLGRQVRDNPIPSLLVGAGLAWLAFAGQEDEDDDEYGEAFGDRHYDSGRRGQGRLLPAQFNAYASEATAEEDRLLHRTGHSTEGGHSLASTAKHKATAVASSLSETAHQGIERASETAAAIGDSISHAASTAKDAVGHAAENIGSAFSSASTAASRGYRDSRQKAQSAYRTAARGSRRAGQSARQVYDTSVHQLEDAYDLTAEGFREAHREYPLGLGFGFLALGALTGLAIPRTRHEDELMGETSDQFMDEAWKTGEQTATRGAEAIRETIATAKHSAEEHGLTGDSLVERATHDGQEAATSLSEAAREEGLHPDQLRKEVKQVAEETSENAARQAEKVTQEAKEKVSELDPQTKSAQVKGGPSPSPKMEGLEDGGTQGESSQVVTEPYSKATPPTSKRTSGP